MRIGEDIGITAYLTPEDSSSASIDMSDRALGWCVGQLTGLYLEKRNLHQRLAQTNDEETIGELEWELKLLRSEESSLHRIESGLQSRLKISS